MNDKTLTLIILGAVIVVLIGWDVYAAVSKEEGDTISAIALDWARKHPIIPFALGILFGHLFWPQQ